MSEPVVRPRYLGEPRDAFDLDEIERRMREAIEPTKPQQPPQPSRPAAEQDPLAELARLVGQTNNDAFHKIFGDQGGPTAPPPSGPRLSEPPPFSVSARDQLYAAAYERGPEPRFEEPYPYASQQRPAQDFAPQDFAPQDYAAQDYAQQDYAPQGYAQQAHDPQAHVQQGYAPEAYPPAQGGQAYAYGQETYPADAPQQDADWRNQYQQDAYYDEPPRRTGRAKLLIGAAVLVVLGGSAAAYFLRGPGVLGRDAPTIMANSGPTKVQPAEQASEGPKQSISILERGGSGSSQSRLVQNEEQPVDVSAAARASGSRPARAPDAGAPVTLAPPPPAVANSIFAEPKRVKAVAVRPDGTIIDATAPARPAAPAAAAPMAAPATPTPAPTPASRPMDIASLVASTTPSSTPASAPKPPVKAADPKPPEAKPVAKPATPPVTSASIPAAGAGGGAYAVQLAGTTSLDEAKEAVGRLARKFSSELGGYRPSVVKADVGSKAVYRVRVVGLSSEDANTLCARLKSGGGSCFVARD